MAVAPVLAIGLLDLLGNVCGTGALCTSVKGDDDKIVGALHTSHGVSGCCDLLDAIRALASRKREHGDAQSKSLPRSDAACRAAVIDTDGVQGTHGRHTAGFLEVASMVVIHAQHVKARLTQVASERRGHAERVAVA
jgi:hypothetical protein